ncbi:carbonic anhydrase family protein [Loigolactobacillus backii]|uniref:carbonic anhydrase family protein n=1 Tax=Loigolactobacillus backii TaxID=375175 RepID=UPI000AE940DC|nr:carbonic anhydrase family protein [Loigolactobacillus backii]
MVKIKVKKSEQMNKLDYQAQSQWAYGAGKQQSPIALEMVPQNILEAADFLEWQGPYYVQDVCDNGNNLLLHGQGHARLDQRLFHLVQLHFHAPAEHTINGELRAMEWHFVHTDAIGKTAVVAVSAVIGRPNPQFEQILAQYETGKLTTFAETILVTSLLPTTGLIYHYVGSLTTPPLIEGVEWYVAEKPFTISQEQLERYQQFFPKTNNRTLQPLNDRQVMQYDLGSND